MKCIDKLPPAFARYEKICGVLDFALFEDADGTVDEVLSAVPQALHFDFSFDAERLRSLGYRRIRERAFFGDWYDPDSASLIKRGSWKTADGSRLEDPRLRTLGRVKIVGGASYCPEIGAGGQFAYAFFCPPYSLNARPREVQALFEEIRDSILPPEHVSEIWDWSSPNLPQVSDYFAAGSEWWGVFLFSIHTPAIRRLTIIAGSATD